MSTDTKVSKLIIHQLTKEQYKQLQEQGLIEENQFYNITDPVYTESETDTLLSGKQNTISDLDEIRSGSDLGRTSVQPGDNISTLTNNAGFITKDVDNLTNYSTTDSLPKVAKSGSYNDLSDKPTIPTVPADVSAFNNDAGYITSEYHDSTKQDVIANLSTIESNALSGKNASDTIATYGNIVTHNANEFQVSGDYATNTSLNQEISDRQDADENLQEQIDGITASKDVKDIVGTHAELQSYDKSTLGDKDIIKVLQDETMEGASTYYEFVFATQTFIYKGKEGPYYTKSETDTLLNEKQPVGDYATKTELSNGLATKQPIGDYATKTELSSGLSEKQDAINDLSTIRTNAEAGKSASDTIATYGDIVTHNTTEFQPAGDYATKTELDTKANDSDVVHLTGDETVTGVKFFTGGAVGDNTKPSIQAQAAIVAGSETSTLSTGLYTNRKVANDSNKINSAGLVVDKWGRTRITHKTGSTTEITKNDDYAIVFAKGVLLYGDGTNGEVFHDIFRDDADYSKLETNNKQIIKCEWCN